MAKKKIIEPINSIEVNKINIETSALDNIIKGKVNCDLLNVREEANVDSRILSVINKNTEVDIKDFKENSKWHSIEIGNVRGYVMSEFISLN